MTKQVETLEGSPTIVGNTDGPGLGQGLTLGKRVARKVESTINPGDINYSVLKEAPKGSPMVINSSQNGIQVIQLEVVDLENENPIFASINGKIGQINAKKIMACPGMVIEHNNLGTVMIQRIFWNGDKCLVNVSIDNPHGAQYVDVNWESLIFP